MDKEAIKGFIAWLETASEMAIKDRQSQFKSMLNLVSSAEGRADLRLGLRLIDEELLARLELANLKSPTPGGHEA